MKRQLENYILDLTLTKVDRMNILHKKKDFWHFAYALHKNVIVESSQNLPFYFTTSNYTTKKRSIHAEESLSLKLVKKFGLHYIRHTTLVVVRYSKLTNLLVESKPCCSCSLLITNLRFKDCYYSNNDGYFVRL